MALSLLVASAGCTGPAARRDVEALAAAHGVRFPDLRCDPVGHTRDVVCRSPLAAADVARLVAGLGLAPPSPAHPSPLPAGPRACAPSAGGTLYVSSRRAPSLRIGATQLEHLALHHDPATGTVCIDTSYAYG